MTTPAPDPAEATRAALVEALAEAIYLFDPFPGHDDSGFGPMLWSELPSWAQGRNRARAEALVSGHLADLAARLTEAERRAEDLSAAAVDLRTEKDRVTLESMAHFHRANDAIAERDTATADHDASHAETVRLRARVVELETENERLRRDDHAEG